VEKNRREIGEIKVHDEEGRKTGVVSEKEKWSQAFQPRIGWRGNVRGA